MREFIRVKDAVFGTLVFLLCYQSKAQEAKKDTSFKPSGKLWGYVFGDYYYKTHSDSLNRGGANQYTGIEQGRNAFQIRRVYLGYNYEINPKFSAEMLLAAEDNITTRTNITNGDLLANNKLSFFIKYANLRWKNIWKGSDLIIGLAPTPAFPLIVDPVWNYRAIERTLTDVRRTPSFDLGVALQGKFDPDSGRFGYHIMVGNGTGARPENDKFKWFYGDVYAKLFNKKLTLDFYADYQRLNQLPNFNRSRNMLKFFAGYVTPKFTAGIEAFNNHEENDIIRIGANGVKDTLDANAIGVSVFFRGIIIKDQLGYFARIDNYSPDVNYESTDYAGNASYVGLSANYEPNTREQFITVGLDFTPVKNVHFMPNIWYNRYKSQQVGMSGSINHDYDLVYRITFFYSYGR